MSEKDIVKALLQDRVVAYHPLLAKIFGGVGTALFLSQLLYWSDKGRLGDGWIYKTQAEFTEETGLSRKEQETARKHLVTHGVLEEERRDIPARLYYRIVWWALTDKLDAQIGQSSMSLSGNQDAQNGQSFNYTETTTETTTEKEDAHASNPLPKRKTSKVDQPFMEQIRAKYPSLNVDDEVGQAMSRNAFTKTSDKQKYVTQWLDRAIKFQEERIPPSSGRPPQRRGATRSELGTREEMEQGFARQTAERAALDLADEEAGGGSGNNRLRRDHAEAGGPQGGSGGPEPGVAGVSEGPREQFLL